MTKKLEIYKCNVCGNVVEVFTAGAGALVCCGEEMQLMEEKLKDEGNEKHVPFMEKQSGETIVKTGEVPHPMTDEHHIEWIEVYTADHMEKKCFESGDSPIIKVHSDDIVKARSYCNIHGLWAKESDALKIIEVGNYEKDQLILMALKSEIDSEEIYRNLADKTENSFLKTKMTFLADEEKKHKEYFEELFNEMFPDKNVELPEDDFAPLPDIDLNKEQPVSEIMRKAMLVEEAAHDFYMELSHVFAESKKLANMLKFFASMEMIHYAILKNEAENIERDEDYLARWPMIHVGP